MGAPSTVEVAESADIFFVNKGGNEAPGQNNPPFQSLGQTIVRQNAKNRSVTFKLTVDLGDALEELAGSAEPPNGNWKT